MVTFRTVGDPIVHIDEIVDKKVKFSVAELLDPQYPYINILGGAYEYEDDVPSLKDLPVLQLSEPRGHAWELLKYASVPLEVVPRNNQLQNPLAKQLLIDYRDIVGQDGEHGTGNWSLYRIQVTFPKTLLRYHYRNSVLNGSALVQLAGGDLLIEDNKRCLTIHRCTAPGGESRTIQIEFPNRKNREDCEYIVLTEESGGIMVSRYYSGVFYDESEIISRVLNPRYGYRSLHI